MLTLLPNLFANCDIKSIQEFCFEADARMKHFEGHCNIMDRLTLVTLHKTFKRCSFLREMFKSSRTFCIGNSPLDFSRGREKKSL